jgi:hypothetical protein
MKMGTSLIFALLPPPLIERVPNMNLPPLSTSLTRAAAADQPHLRKAAKLAMRLYLELDDARAEAEASGDPGLAFHLEWIGSALALREREPA